MDDKSGDKGKVLLEVPITTEEIVKHPDVLNLLLYHLEQEHRYTSQDLAKFMAIVRESESVPLSIFSARLSGFETIVKYLTENCRLSNRQISDLLNRDIRTVWGTYKKTLTKHPEKFNPSQMEKFKIPLSLFATRRLSTLETIVSHLNENYNLSHKEIAGLLKRDISTVWTAYRRAKQKTAIQHDANVEGY
jgi:hypothetical protein